MRTLLTINRNQKGNIVERRVSYSKSFVKNLWELLYVHHAQIQFAAPRIVTDALGATRNLDAQAYAGHARDWKGNLACVAPSGGVGFWVPTGGYYYSTNYYDHFYHFAMLPGELLGIQVGSGVAAVIPDDKKLSFRIPHGLRTAIGVPTMVDGLISGDDTSADVYGVSYHAIIGFVPVRQRQTATSVSFLMYRQGSPGDITLLVSPATPYGSSSYVTTGGILDTVISNGNTLTTVSPGEWRTFTFAAPITFLTGMPYLFIIQALTGTSSNKLLVRRDNAHSIYSRYSYQAYNLPTSLTPAKSFLFNLQATAPAEIEYGGCDVGNFTASGASVSFTIRRLFTNHSGGDLTIAECGIYAAGTIATNDTLAGMSFPLCIARDLVDPAITLQNNEVLEVAYTPLITV